MSSMQGRQYRQRSGTALFYLEGVEDMKKHLIALMSVNLLAGCSNASVSSVPSPYQYDQSLSDGKVMIKDEHNCIYTVEMGKNIPVMTMVINGYQSEQYKWINDTAAQLQVMIPFEGEEVTDNSVYTMTIPAMDTGIEGGQDIIVSWNYASKTDTVCLDKMTLPEGVDDDILQAVSEEQLGILSKELVEAAPEIRRIAVENQK